MAGWVKFDNGIGGHPKVLALADELYLSGLGLQLLAVCYCDQHRTDGFIPGKALRRISPVDCEQEASELVRAGMWDTVDGGYRVHDYLAWQRSAAEIDAASESARRAANIRHGKETCDRPSDATRNATRNAEGTSDGTADKNRVARADTDKNSLTAEGVAEDWKDFLEAYPKQSAKGDDGRFAGLSPQQRRQAVSAAHEYAAASKAIEERFRKGVSTFLSDPVQLEVLAERWDAKTAKQAEIEAARLERIANPSPPPVETSDEEWEQLRDCAAAAKATLDKLSSPSAKTDPNPTITPASEPSDGTERESR